MYRYHIWSVYLVPLSSYFIWKILWPWNLGRGSPKIIGAVAAVRDLINCLNNLNKLCSVDYTVVLAGNFNFSKYRLVRPSFDFKLRSMFCFIHPVHKNRMCSNSLCVMSHDTMLLVRVHLLTWCYVTTLLLFIMFKCVHRLVLVSSDQSVLK